MRIREEFPFLEYPCVENIRVLHPVLHNGTVNR